MTSQQIGGLGASLKYLKAHHVELSTLSRILFSNSEHSLTPVFYWTGRTGLSGAVCVTVEW